MAGKTVLGLDGSDRTEASMIDCGFSVGSCSLSSDAQSSDARLLPNDPTAREIFSHLRERMTRALHGHEDGNSGEGVRLNMSLHPDLYGARLFGKQTKIFYALMRHFSEHALRQGTAPLLDIGSSIEVDEDQFSALQPVIAEAHEESLREGHYTNYPSSWGLLRLRRSIAALYQRKYGVSLDHEREVMVTGGIIKAVDILLQALNVQHVVVPSLSPSYLFSMARLRGKNIIPVDLNLRDGSFDLDRLARELNVRRLYPGGSNESALFYMTLPSAPAGTLPDEKFMQDELIPFLQRYGLPTVSDSYIYATSFCGKGVRPFMTYKGARDVGVETITLSKELGLPGIRMGGMVGNREIINAVRLFASSVLDMIPLPNQNLAAHALDRIDPGPVAKRVSAELHDEILPGFEKLGWPVLRPQAGLDLLVAVPQVFQREVPNCSQRSFYAAIALLMKYGVGFCPVSECGEEESGKWLRVVIKQNDRKVARALERLANCGFRWDTFSIDPGLFSAIRMLEDEIDITKL